MNSRIKRYARRLDGGKTFVPAGIPKKELIMNQMGLDEFEAIRLVDYDGLSQVEASEAMQVSRATLQRLLLKARKKMVDTVLHNKGLDIDNKIVNIKLKGENNMNIEEKEIIKIAFPTSNRSTIDGHFGKTEEFMIFTIKDVDVIAITHITPPPHAPGVIPAFLAENDVDVVITGGMGRKAIELFDAAGIDVILGAKGRVDVNLNEYLGGFLSSHGNICKNERNTNLTKDGVDTFENSSK